MSHAALMAGYSNPLIVVDGADFDGTNDYMLRGAELTGIADSKSGIFSCWVRIDALTGGQQDILSNGVYATKFNILITSTGEIVIRGCNAAGSAIIDFRSSSHSAGATWLHILMSWDLATTTTHLYILDISDKAVTTATNDTINYTEGNYGVGASITATLKVNGCLAEIYFAPGQYLDFSLEYNRRKFISSTGKPVHLGITGATPTGTAPLVYMHLDNGEAVANFATNRGTGGNFTITGTLDTASSSPSD